MSSFAKGNPFSIFFGDPFFWDPLFSFFLFFPSPAKVGSLEMQPGAKLQAYLGVSILQPHAPVLCVQHVSAVHFLPRGLRHGGLPYFRTWCLASWLLGWVLLVYCRCHCVAPFARSGFPPPRAHWWCFYAASLLARPCPVGR